jgi:hypothetical protein
MCGQYTASHALSLRLENGLLSTDDKFQLNRCRTDNLGQIVVTTFETERPVTLVCNNLHVNNKSRTLDLLGALKSGLVEQVESGKNDVLALPPTETQQLDQLIIPPKPSPKHAQVKVSVYTDTTTFEWKELLQPGHAYGVRLSKNKDEVWGYYTEDFGSPNNVPLTQRLAVGRENSTIYFTVCNDPALLSS